MRLSAKQNGVTLVEILVGFVIFTSSLVAILDYVTEQNYHYYLSSTYLKKIQTVYNHATLDLGMDQHLAQSADSQDISLTVSATAMDAFGQEGEERLLMRFNYQIPDSKNSLAWTVIKFK